jgi:hypothetical protein
MRSRGSLFSFARCRVALVYFNQPSSSLPPYVSMSPMRAPAGSAITRPASHPKARLKVSPLVNAPVRTLVYLWKRLMARAARQLVIGVVGSAVDTGTSAHSPRACGSAKVTLADIQSGIAAARQSVNKKTIGAMALTSRPVSRWDASLRHSSPSRPDSLSHQVRGRARDLRLPRGVLQLGPPSFRERTAQPCRIRAAPSSQAH